MKKLLLVLSLFTITPMVWGQQATAFSTSDGETLFYTSIGKGARIVMLNGGPGSIPFF